MLSVVRPSHRAWSCLRRIFSATGRVGRSMEATVVERRGGRWVIGGEEWAAGVRVCRTAESRRHANADGTVPQRLITLRDDFREISHRRYVAGMFLCVDHPIVESRRLGIWLLGRTRAVAAISEVARFMNSSDVLVRREAARALRRLGAWAILRAAAASDPDERVRRLATPLRPRPFASRLQQVVSSLTSDSARSRQTTMPLYVQLPIGPGRAAKTAAMIRAILERIRQTLAH